MDMTQQITAIKNARHDKRIKANYDLFMAQWKNDDDATHHWSDDLRTINDALAHHNAKSGDLCALAFPYLIAQAVLNNVNTDNMAEFSDAAIEKTLSRRSLDAELFINDENYRIETIVNDINAVLGFFHLGHFQQTLILVLWVIALDQ